MLVERPGVVQQAAALVEQVVEVQRAFLRARVLLALDRVDRPLLDARLDLRGRVDADRRDGVVDRVEEVVLRPRVDRVRPAARPHDGVGELREVEALPRRLVFRVRPDEDRRLAHARVRCRAKRPQPVHHERRLLGRDERRGAQIEEVRPVGRQAHLRRELLARRARPPVEPLVEHRRAGDHDVIRRHAVHLDRLPLLRLVPDEDAIGKQPDEPLVGQVVPAVDGEAGGNAHRLRALHEVRLIGSEIHQRRDEHEVGVLRADDLVDPAVGRDGAIGQDQEPPKRTPAGARVDERQPAEAGHDPRDPQLRPLAQLDRALVLRLEIAQVVHPPAHAARQAQPEAVGRLLRQLAVGDVRVVVEELVEQPSVAVPVGDHERQVDVVPSLGQRADGRREVPKRALMAHGKEDLHRSRSERRLTSWDDKAASPRSAPKTRRPSPSLPRPAGRRRRPRETPLNRAPSQGCWVERKRSVIPPWPPGRQFPNDGPPRPRERQFPPWPPGRQFPACPPEYQPPGAARVGQRPIRPSVAS